MSATQRTRSADTVALLEHGAMLHARSRLEEAADVYRRILCHDPAHFDATHLLGVIALQQGRYDHAQQLIGAAVNISPRDDAALGNLGVSYMSAGRLASACEWFRVALLLRPDSALAMLNLGTALQRLGRDREAASILQQAFDADPTSYEVSLRLGQSLLADGETHAAVAAFESATLADPQAPEGWRRLALAWAEAGEPARALECRERAQELEPGAKPAGNPGIPPVVADAPGPVLCQTAYVLLANGYADEAIERLRRVLAEEPSNLNARWVLALAPLRPVYENIAQMTAAREAFSLSLDQISTWYAEHRAEVKDPYAALGILQPFTLAYQPFNNRELLTRYGKLCADLMATLPIDAAGLGLDGTLTPTRDRSLRGDRIRLGIASAHIKDHSVWHAITKGLVQKIDRSKFDLCVFQLNRDADEETLQARKIVAEVEDRPTKLADWAGAIKASNLDVLLYPSVGMDPLTQQLAALRLAPIQAVTWGHPETTGFPTLDIYLSAELLEPANAEGHYSERLVRLPNLGVYVEPLAPPQAALDLAALGLPDDAPLLLCPGTPFKYSPQTDDVWVAIAKGLQKRLFGKSRGRLVFFRSQMANLDRVLETRLRAAFARADLDFERSVSIVPNLDRGRYFALMRHAACLLDTLEFSGFNTALQALQCDLPVLAYEGEFMRGRLASALLRKLDLPALVATTKQEFIAKAIDLARDATKRRSLRDAVSRRRETLFRDEAPVRALEELLAGEVSRFRAASG